MEELVGCKIWCTNHKRNVHGGTSLCRVSRILDDSQECFKLFLTAISYGLTSKDNPGMIGDKADRQTVVNIDFLISEGILVLSPVFM
jgi:hypothetical protein